VQKRCLNSVCKQSAVIAAITSRSDKVIISKSFICVVLSLLRSGRQNDSYKSLTRRPAQRNTPEPISSTLHLRAVLWRFPVTRYFFHILDGPKVFPDEVGRSFSSSVEAIRQAECLAVELSKAGDFCRSNLVLVVDEHGHRIFECPASQRV
jgi:hypothetical protein